MPSALSSNSQEVRKRIGPPFLVNRADWAALFSEQGSLARLSLPWPLVRPVYECSTKTPTIVTQFFFRCDASDSSVTLIDVIVFDLLKFEVRSG